MINIPIRNFPLSKTKPLQRYYLMHQNQLLKIPVGNINCMGTCYRQFQSLDQKQQLCKKCGAKIDPKDNFIDIGLLQLINSNKDEIVNKKYTSVELNHTTNKIIKWYNAPSVGFIPELSEYATLIIQNSIKQDKDIKNLNLCSVKQIIKEQFQKLNQINVSLRFLWCRRATNNSGQHFQKLVFLTDNKLMFINLVDSQGSTLKFKDKHTTIAFLSKIGIFLFFQNEQSTGSMTVYYAKVTLDQTMILYQVDGSTKKLMNRRWYSLCVDNLKQEVYLVGGIAANNENVNIIQKICNIRFEDNKLNYDIQSKINLSDTRLCPGVIIGSYNSDYDKNAREIMIFSGVMFNKRENKKQLINKFISIYLEPEIKECRNAEKYDLISGVNPHIIEIPDQGLLLIFGGTKDWQHDEPSKKKAQNVMALLDVRDQQIIQTFPFNENENLLYSCDKSAVYLMDKQNNPYIQMLLPTRYKQTTKIVAYLFTFFIKQRKSEIKPIKYQPI